MMPFKLFKNIRSVILHMYLAWFSVLWLISIKRSSSIYTKIHAQPLKNRWTQKNMRFYSLKINLITRLLYLVVFSMLLKLKNRMNLQIYLLKFILIRRIHMFMPSWLVLHLPLAILPIHIQLIKSQITMKSHLKMQTYEKTSVNLLMIFTTTNWPIKAWIMI